MGDSLLREREPGKLFLLLFSTAAVVVNINEGIVGSAFTTTSPPAGVAVVIAQPVALNGRGQTAQTKTAGQTGIIEIHKMEKLSLCLCLILFGMDTKAMKYLSSYANHVSFIYTRDV